MTMLAKSRISTIALIVSLLACCVLMYCLLAQMGCPSPACDDACQQARAATSRRFSIISSTAIGGYVLALMLAIYSWRAGWKRALLTLLMPLIILGIYLGV